MNKEDYMQESLDVKRLFLVLEKKLWVVLAGILLGALLGAAGYKLVTGLTNSEPEYRASADYYITFDFGKFEHGDDYYNAYTWDGILRDDPIVDYALTLLPAEITKDMVKQTVTGEMLGDYRVLTVHATAATKELADTISEAYSKALPHFGEEMELFQSIEPWSREEAVAVEKNTKTANAAALGAILGGLFSLFGLLFYYCLEDAVYTEWDVYKYSSLPVFGMATVKGNAEEQQLLNMNLNYAFGRRTEIPEWNIGEIPTEEALVKLRAEEGLILRIFWGKTGGREILRYLSFMEQQGCKVKGFLLTEVDDNFLRRYMSTWKKRA